MKMMKLSRMLSLMLAICLMASMAVFPANAAEIADATVNMDQECKLTIYKYDFTNAAKDGIWTQDSYVSTGQYDANINEILGEATRQGDADSESVLGNSQNSKGYAVKGVEYTYLQVADLYQYEQAGHVEVLYKFDKQLAADLLTAIDLADGKHSYEDANDLDDTSWYYQSDVLNQAMADSLADNATTVKNALEAYVKGNGGVAMPLTDQNGRSIVTELPVGLYLLVETKVPEQVTTTTNPFFVSLPMTNVNGGGDGSNGNSASVTDGGHEWLYDVTLYPKNETGIVTLEKTVREALKDTATHGGSTTDITDGYKHYATASGGDTVEYQIISTLPTITSTATNVAEYTIKDILARGLDYSDDIKIEWFTDSACSPENKVATWTLADGKFDISEIKNSDKSHTMEITMTDKGLAEINAANTAADNVNGSLYAGYSNYTMRITYSATMNSDESIVYGDEGNCNEVVLTWRRTSNDYFDTLIDDCHIFTYGIDLSKEWSDKTPSEAKDAGMYEHVLFNVQNKNDNYYVVAELNEEEGIWYVTGHTTSESTATDMHPVDWNGKNGQLVIKGLEDDEYILTEIETANGYVLLKENISVVISTEDDATRPCDVYSSDVIGAVQNDSRFNFDGGMDLHLAGIPQQSMAHNFLTASATVDGNAVTMINDETDSDSSNALVPLSVVNTRGFDLPQSGEVGIRWLPLVGALIIGLSILALGVTFAYQKRNKAEK